MAKSAGNLVLVSELLEDYPAGAIRLLILDRRWDQDWDYDRAGLDRAAPSWGCDERRGQRTASPGAPADHHPPRTRLAG
jgi:cysteinyl-tRNA synthetase